MPPTPPLRFTRTPVPDAKECRKRRAWESSPTFWKQIGVRMRQKAAERMLVKQQSRYAVDTMTWFEGISLIRPPGNAEAGSDDGTSRGPQRQAEATLQP